ncbi:MAG: ABC transporter permease [Pseudomonadota bacterium]
MVEGQGGRGLQGEQTGGATLTADGGAMRLALHGRWTIDGAARLERLLDRLVARAGLDAGNAGTLAVDLSAVRELDTAGAWLINRLRHPAPGLRPCGAANTEASATLTAPATLTGVRSDHALLLELVAANGAQAPGGQSRARGTTLISDLGRGTGDTARYLHALIALLGAVLAGLGRAFVRPRSFRLQPFVHHLDHAGLRAVPIVALICVLIGAVVMQQGASQLAAYGAEVYAVELVAILSLREIGVLLTAILVAGRTASAFTAEIGAMKMREEIDAMRTLDIEPVAALVIPRVLALLIAVPLLVFVADVMCLVGGWVVASVRLGMEPFDYLLRLQDAIEPRHLFVGLIKTPAIALAIALIGCLEGLRTAGSAESLGQHVTGAVVKAIFVVIVLDAIFALFLLAIGL